MSGGSPAPAGSLAVREVALAQARALARVGRYAEAEELLEGPWDEAEQSVTALDLKARIHAQQGRLDEADRCWAEVAELAPGNAAATEGRRRIAAVRAGAASSGFSGRILTARFVRRAGAGLVALLAFVMLADLWLDGGVREPAAAPPAVPAPSAPVQPSAPATGDALAGLRLDGPGVRVQRRSGEIAVTFERGLFREGATLSARGRTVLNDLGERLRPYGDRISITVIGHSDRSAVRPGGEYASNVELGTVRATVVREVLRTSARMPTSRFSVSTLAGMLPPFPGEGARNRTVSLRVSAAGVP
jgi:flagellar motor protein MotB